MENNKFLAKSENKETIMTHTEKLLKEYENLGTMYPQLKGNKICWDMLCLACLYHDFGKVNQEFQNRINKSGKGLLEGEIHHAVLSTFCLDKTIIERYFKGYAQEIYSSILFHHHRKSLLDYEADDIKQKLRDLKNDFYEMISQIKSNADKYRRLCDAVNKYVLTEKEDGNAPELVFRSKYYRQYPYDILAGIDVAIHKSSCQTGETERAVAYIFLKGLLNRIDYAASAYTEVEHRNNFLEAGLTAFMEDLNQEREKRGETKTDWNALQKYMRENQDANIIVLAQTGMGKTEAALWWIGNNKGFFTLPLRTAINSIYKRIKTKIIKNTEIDKRLGLLHAESFEYYMNLQREENQETKEALFDLEDYYTKTKQLSLPLTITTLDQLFLFVFRYIGYEERLATMAYSKVVIDEIQMYGADLTAYLVVGLSMIQKMGGKFAILTATFPSFIQDLLEESGIEFKKPVKKFFESGYNRHSVKIENQAINAEFIFKQYTHNNRVLVICNTVKKCQTIYKDLVKIMGLTLEELKKQDIQDRALNMLHAKYIKKDRAELEESISRFTDKDSCSTGIWITSSIAEASLDIDFDILITELSDINSLFQRMGRCFRRRIWNAEGYNCFVFDGGDEYCSGVGEKMPIDEEIFSMSRKELRRYFSNAPSVLSEETKMELVEKMYSTKNIKENAQNYYSKVIDNLKKPRYFDVNGMNKREAQRRFRNIFSFSIIPESVFNDNKTEILRLKEQLENTDISFKEKVVIRQRLHSYTVDVDLNSYSKMGAAIGSISLNKYQKIEIKRCLYDELIGVEILEQKGKNVGEGEFW